MEEEQSIARRLEVRIEEQQQQLDGLTRQVDILTRVFDDLKEIDDDLNSQLLTTTTTMHVEEYNDCGDNDDRRSDRQGHLCRGCCT